jgi:hypothetical protein
MKYKYYQNVTYYLHSEFTFEMQHALVNAEQIIRFFRRANILLVALWYLWHCLLLPYVSTLSYIW